MLPHVKRPERTIFSVLLYSDIILWNDVDAPAICHIPITEYLVNVLLCFRRAARDSEVCVTCIDPRTNGNGRGFLVQLPSSIPPEVDDISLLEIMHCTTFDPDALLVAYFRSSVVDWAWVKPAER